MRLPANERLRGRIQFVRDKVHTVMLQLEDLRVPPEDVPMEELKAVKEWVGDLKKMSDLCGRKEALSNETQERLDQQIFIADRIIQYRLGRLVAHLIGRLGGRKHPTVGGLRCPCGSGRSFDRCCGSRTGAEGSGT